MDAADARSDFDTSHQKIEDHGTSASGRSDESLVASVVDLRFAGREP